MGTAAAACPISSSLSNDAPLSPLICSLDFCGVSSSNSSSYASSSSAFSAAPLPLGDTLPAPSSDFWVASWGDGESKSPNSSSSSCAGPDADATAVVSASSSDESKLPSAFDAPARRPGPAWLLGTCPAAALPEPGTWGSSSSSSKPAPSGTSSAIPSSKSSS